MRCGASRSRSPSSGSSNPKRTGILGSLPKPRSPTTTATSTSLSGRSIPTPTVFSSCSRGGEFGAAGRADRSRRPAVAAPAGHCSIPVTKNVSVAAGGGFDRSQKVTGGADLKYGITSNLTLDATVNPDFGQVEADPAVLNLTAFESFFQERRPFFVQGAGIFRFDVNCAAVNDCSTGEGLFYSRRIGRSPQLA